MFRGVAYLHTSLPPLVHQDIKSYDIYQDYSVYTCIFIVSFISFHYTCRRSKCTYRRALSCSTGRLGFALEIPKSESGRTMITAPLVARTEGYFPPELLTGKVSPLCGVFSCGVSSICDVNDLSLT